MTMMRKEKDTKMMVVIIKEEEVETEEAGKEKKEDVVQGVKYLPFLLLCVLIECCFLAVFCIFYF